MSESTGDLSQLVESLKREATAAQNSLKVTLGVAVVLTVFVAGYLTFAYQSIKRLVDPGELALFTVGLVQDNLIQGITSLSDAAEAQAPAMVERLYQAVGEGSVDARMQIAKRLEDADKEFGSAAEGWVKDYFTRMVKENQQLRLAAHKDPDVAEHAFEAKGKDGKVDRHVLAGEIRKDMDTLFSAGADAELKDISAVLKKLRERLDKYATPGAKLTPEEQEEKDLLFAWFQFLDADAKGLKAAAKDLRDAKLEP